MNEPDTITYKEAAALLGLSDRHAKRKIAAWSIQPVGFTGNRPLFVRSAVMGAKEAETARRLALFAGQASHVLPLKEIRRQAGKGKAAK
jgi:excisionase family DNA binding protein